jgi:hypothetical protein
MISLGMRVFVIFLLSRSFCVFCVYIYIHGHICILLGSCLVYLKILLDLFSGISDALFVCKEKAMGR